jgi:hypothetical protein
MSSGIGYPLEAMSTLQSSTLTVACVAAEALRAFSHVSFYTTDGTMITYQRALTGQVHRYMIGHTSGTEWVEEHELYDVMQRVARIAVHVMITWSGEQRALARESTLVAWDISAWAWR